jgi:hypothetical protein
MQKNQGGVTLEIRPVIEIVQGLAIVHRDRDFWDWVADTIAIIAALSPMLLVWWRPLARATQKNSET